MAEQIVTLQPNESKLVSFEATPHEARAYQVSVDGLTGAFEAIAKPAEFYMPPKMSMSIWEHDILQWHYHQITYSLTITNRGGLAGSHRIEWDCFYNGTRFTGGQKTISLGPSESYKWSKSVDIDFSRCHTGTCKLYGNWKENNYSEGVVVEGVPA